MKPALLFHQAGGRLGRARRDGVAHAGRRRLVYTLASPAIPFLRGYRTFRHAARVGETAALARSLPFLCATLVAQSAGEAYGFALGPGSMTQLFDMELQRLDYLASDDALRRR